MKFVYCAFCGSKAVEKEIGDEGMMPYCNTCQKPLFDLIQTSIITGVINENNEIVLLKQNYVSKDNMVLIAGHIKSGDNAEDTVLREVYEEVGLNPEGTEYIGSYYHARGDMLMLGFMTYAKKADLKLSGEVDEAVWCPFETALEKLRKGSIAYRLADEIIYKATHKLR